VKCQRCGGPTRIPDSREVEGGDVVVRIRRCTSRGCGWSFATDERALVSAPRPVEPRKGRGPYP
jgi:transcriptional regulator NrdR family protein